jgi:ABC-type cobalamin/Fe3+-siderophores transport system ATPase subunit
VEERATRAASVFTDRFDPGWFTVAEIVAFGRFPYTDLRNNAASPPPKARTRAFASCTPKASRQKNRCRKS